ncbi:hypothetical protein A3I58_00325 [Candidatus Peregrinibacteria bacterium RIFCSPLOWO2_02_FULL_39_10]|nr:MAG: hypothetical protein A3I58_00325 [Candidatus Peregrinibacteria bacterium RIFCSPLOWO2_02_FULL_39_10]
MIEHVTLDSSFLVSFFSVSESHFEASKKLMNFADQKKIILLVPMIVLLEAFHTLRRTGIFENHHEYNKFQSFLNSESIKYFDLDMSFFNMFKEFPFFNELKTSDAIIAASAFINKSILISWDKKLLQNSWQGYTPDGFLKKFA